MQHVHMLACNILAASEMPLVLTLYLMEVKPWQDRVTALLLAAVFCGPFESGWYATC